MGWNINRLVESFGGIIRDDEKRRSFQARLIYLAFCGIAFVMSIINIVTAQWYLLMATSSFCLLCLLDYYLERRGKTTAKLASFLFVLEVIVLFSYFVFTGGTNGFSIIWLLLLPTVGLLFFGFGKGTLMSMAMLVIMLLFFLIPVPSMRERAISIYGETFVTRFPVVYICSYVISCLLEFVRFVTAREMNDARCKYEHLYNHDALTGAFNRHALNERMKKLLDQGQYSVAAMILDIDLFKKVNDTYGHMDGDLVLKQLVEVIGSQITETESIYRWGGEEFTVLFPDVEEAHSAAERVLQAVRDHEFILSRDTIHVTVSIGLAMSDDCRRQEDFEHLILIADECLYQAKNQGRNRLVMKKVTLVRNK